MTRRCGYQHAPTGLLTFFLNRLNREDYLQASGKILMPESETLSQEELSRSGTVDRQTLPVYFTAQVQTEARALPIW